MSIPHRDRGDILFLREGTTDEKDKAESPTLLA